MDIPIETQDVEFAEHVTQAMDGRGLLVPLSDERRREHIQRLARAHAQLRHDRTPQARSSDFVPRVAFAMLRNRLVELRKEGDHGTSCIAWKESDPVWKGHDERCARCIDIDRVLDATEHA